RRVMVVKVALHVREQPRKYDIAILERCDVSSPSPFLEQMDEIGFEQFFPGTDLFEVFLGGVDGKSSRGETPGIALQGKDMIFVSFLGHPGVTGAPSETVLLVHKEYHPEGPLGSIPRLL